MRGALVIAGRDTRSNFVTPTAYVLLAGYVIVAGFFFLVTLSYFNSQLYKASVLSESAPTLNQWVVTPFFHTVEVLLLFIVPLLTMRSFSEERSAGTFELLVTSPLSVTEIVVGKFLSLALMILAVVALSMIFPLALNSIADFELGPLWIAGAMLYIFGLAAASWGMALSSMTSSQTIAGFLTMVSLLLLYFINAPASRLGEPFASVLNYLAPSTHTRDAFKGVLVGSDVVFFLSAISLGIFIALRVLDRERWR